MEVISDGHSKTVAQLRKMKPYGDLEIVKHECIGHISMRVGKRFRATKKVKNSTTYLQCNTNHTTHFRTF